MHEAYLTLNGVRTSIVSYGRWVEESLTDSKDVVVILLGNPGVTGFYKKFAKSIHDQLGYPVWCIGHAGHNIPEEKISPLPKLDAKPELYGVKGQIEHKVDFFAKYIPTDARVHLIGHSLGAYISLELLEHQSISDKISNVFLLFPTVEHIGSTSNGKFLTTFVKPIVWLVVLLAWLFTFFPKIIQTFLLYIYMCVAGVQENEQLESIRSLIKPSILKRVFFLAFEEFDVIKERNNNIIKKNIGKIKFYFGKYDRWAPQSYYERLVDDIPGVNAQLCTYNHVFVFKSSAEIGRIVSDWILGKP